MFIVNRSYKYFSNLRRSEISQTLRGSNYAIYIANNRLYSSSRLVTKASNICVHIRRGDFTNSTMHLPSDAQFTIAGLKMLIEKAYSEDNTKPRVYIFTDNIGWTKAKVVKPFERLNVNNISLQIAIPHAHQPPNVEWEFSRMYCDWMLLTAATSTYGWWLGFLSKGQKVYYNERHFRPGDRPDEFSSLDFWLPQWIPLLNSSNNSRMIEL
ncbi:hypothetical protein DICVIV_10829 [Dictyocaulus viviparus]|uniref:L-Fucosyltransferase n=1 Tax=Dictyocaulus viviparus TaxID=29172 RepID=A0A0D8XLA9_DICVI|nr:hypothetical protein DICVIV_10829 [Dictyocaulus viviparus]